MSAANRVCTEPQRLASRRAIDLVTPGQQRGYRSIRLEHSEGSVPVRGHRWPRVFGVEKTYRSQVAGHATRRTLRQLAQGSLAKRSHVRAKHIKPREEAGE